MADMIDNLTVSAYRIPTDGPESDGTLEWDSTTMVLVETEAGGKKGIGYTYGDKSIAAFIESRLKGRVLGRHPFDIAGIMTDLSISIRNEGQVGLSRMAISAIDVALWDLKARLLDIPLCRLIGMVRDKAMVYGSGGFTSYSDDRLVDQLSEWVREGFLHVKMKVGRRPEKDVYRVKRVREAIGPDVSLYVDANGAYNVKQASEFANEFLPNGISWFEEPVSSDDLPGLQNIRYMAPSPIRVAAGEYGYTKDYFLRLLQMQAVDILQADGTRCGGITGILEAGLLSDAFHIPFSFHCAPALHLHAAVCIPSFFIGEYFYDHVRVEQLLFDGVRNPVNGMLLPDLAAPGMGLEIRTQDAARFRVC